MKVFAWDFHGTLEEGVEVGFWHILKKIAKKRGIPEDFKLSEVRKLYGITVASYLRHFFPKSSEGEIREMMREVAKIQNQTHLKKYVKAAPGSIEVLTKIKKAGHANVILSNSHPKHIFPLVKMVGMASLIDEIYTIDRHYTHKKLDPVVEKTRILKQLIAKNNLAKGELIAIGDSPNDIAAGKAAGAITYQYIPQGFPVRKTNAHFKIRDFDEILKEL